MIEFEFLFVCWMETIGSNFRDLLSTVFTRLWLVSEIDIKGFAWMEGFGLQIYDLFSCHEKDSISCKRPLISMIII